MRSGLKIEIQRPFDFIAFSLKIMGFAGTLGLAHFLYSRGGKVIRSKYLWASVSLVLYYVFVLLGMLCLLHPLTCLLGIFFSF
jgi:hypothetical protein